MKICIISNFYPPFFFGGEKAIQREAEGLARRGNNVTVITSSPHKKAYIEEINGVEIDRIVPFNLYPPYEFQSKPALIKPLYYLLDIWNPLTSRLLKKTLKQIKPDVVYIHNFKGLSLGVFGAVKSLGIPSYFCVNDYSLVCPRVALLTSSSKICSNPRLPCKIYSQIQKRYIDMNRPGMVVSVAQFAVDKLKQSGFFNGVETRREVVGIELYERNPVKEYEEINILYAGGLSKHKGGHILIEAFRNVEQPNLRLHLVGKGVDSDEMKRLAGGDPRIIFHGFVSDEELSELRRKANISVVPSIWYDMAQGVICESFSWGIPVIASDIGGIPEFIKPGYNGYLFEPGNVESLSEILRKLTSSVDELKKLELGAFESSRQYSLDGHIQRLEETFTELIQRA